MSFNRYCRHKLASWTTVTMSFSIISYRICIWYYVNIGVLKIWYYIMADNTLFLPIVYESKNNSMFLGHSHTESIGPENTWMNQMTLPSGYRIRNSSSDCLKLSILLIGNECSPERKGETNWNTNAALGSEPGTVPWQAVVLTTSPGDRPYFIHLRHYNNMM